MAVALGYTHESKKTGPKAPSEDKSPFQTIGPGDDTSSSGIGPAPSQTPDLSLAGRMAFDNAMQPAMQLAPGLTVPNLTSPVQAVLGLGKLAMGPFSPIASLLQELAVTDNHAKMMALQSQISNPARTAHTLSETNTVNEGAPTLGQVEGTQSLGKNATPGMLGSPGTTLSPDLTDAMNPSNFSLNAGRISAPAVEGAPAVPAVNSLGINTDGSPSNGNSLFGGGANTSGQGYSGIDGNFAPGTNAPGDGGAAPGAPGTGGTGTGEGGAGVGASGQSPHDGGYIAGGPDTTEGGDVPANLQQGEFVIPRGPMAEMMRDQNPGWQKYGDMLKRSPIGSYIDPKTAAMGQLQDILMGMYGQTPQGQGRGGPGQPDLQGEYMEDAAKSETQKAPASSSSQEEESTGAKAEKGLGRLHRMLQKFA